MFGSLKSVKLLFAAAFVFAGRSKHTLKMKNKLVLDGFKI